eukprot:5714447-Karenia_brevis.AAC.1
MRRSASLDTLPDASNPTMCEGKKTLLPDMRKPEREPPFVFINNPEDLVARLHLDFDWTLTVNKDKDLEHRRREIRNVMIRDPLQSGKN